MDTEISLLILLLGVAVGFWNLISLLAIAFFLSAVVSAAALVFGKFHRKTTVPFVPFFGDWIFFCKSTWRCGMNHMKIRKVKQRER